MGFLIRIPKQYLENLEQIKYLFEIAVDYIISGKLLAFPTDSVYGIGGDPLSPAVVEKLYTIKYRDRNKGFLLLVSDFEEASKIAEFNEIAKILAEKYWPGQMTLILKKKAQNIIPPEVTANQDTIGLRVPDNEIVLEILKMLKSRGKFGGIIGTSANYSGEEPSVSGAEVANIFLGTIDLIIDSGVSKSKMPTTIVDCTKNKINFLRIGIIDEISINEFLKSKGY